MQLDLNQVAARLAHFETQTGTTAPRPFLDGDGAPTSAFLRYCLTAGLSLDWLVGDDDEDARPA